ncbi:MAG: hypothetical protein EOP04_25000 [Proteobacteria bacterium]|nr:MAG: hypothetical protein EOP04_25000 [Pseudomonadota bacterium]
MIKPSFYILIFAALMFLSFDAYSFPENIRHGYASCQSCHVSPSGGGVLTEYGRRASEEFMFTWSKPNEADFLNASVSLPKNLNIGGDVRFLSLHKDNKVTESNVGFPMQADMEFAYKLFDQLTLDVGVGSYDGTPDSRRHFIMYQPNENWFVRAGRFFPAYGIMNPEHSILTRRFLKFDQGQETNNLELGYLNEDFELIVNGISGTMGEEMKRDDGYSARFAYYLGKNNQVGANYLHGEGAIWERDVYGVFALVSIGKNGFIQSEIDLQSRKALDSTDESLPSNKALVTFTRVTWEVARGVNIFESIETLDPSGEDFSPRQRAYGPGVQWFPRPHLELLAKYELKLDEAFSKKYGNQAMLMSHYYF